MSIFSRVDLNCRFSDVADEFLSQLKKYQTNNDVVVKRYNIENPKSIKRSKTL